MATRTRRVVATDRLRQAQQQLRAVNITIARHGLGCSRCALARGDPRKFGDTGWELARAQARARAAVRRLSGPAPGQPVQGTLW